MNEIILNSSKISYWRVDCWARAVPCHSFLSWTFRDISYKPESIRMVWERYIKKAKRFKLYLEDDACDGTLYGNESDVYIGFCYNGDCVTIGICDEQMKYDINLCSDVEAACPEFAEWLREFGRKLFEDYKNKPYLDTI